MTSRLLNFGEAWNALQWKASHHCPSFFFSVCKRTRASLLQKNFNSDAPFYWLVTNMEVSLVIQPCQITFLNLVTVISSESFTHQQYLSHVHMSTLSTMVYLWTFLWHSPPSGWVWGWPAAWPPSRCWSAQRPAWYCWVWRKCTLCLSWWHALCAQCGEHSPPNSWGSQSSPQTWCRLHLFVKET